MDAHRLAEERSLAFHRAVMEKAAHDPSVVSRARVRVEEWRASGRVHMEYVEAWSAILALPMPRVVDAVLDPSERGRALRQVTPFAGAIDPRARWRLWKETRARFERGAR